MATPPQSKPENPYSFMRYYLFGVGGVSGRINKIETAICVYIWHFLVCSLLRPKARIGPC